MTKGDLTALIIGMEKGSTVWNIRASSLKHYHKGDQPRFAVILPAVGFPHIFRTAPWKTVADLCKKVSEKIPMPKPKVIHGTRGFYTAMYPSGNPKARVCEICGESVPADEWAATVLLNSAKVSNAEQSICSPALLIYRMEALIKSKGIALEYRDLSNFEPKSLKRREGAPELVSITGWSGNREIFVDSQKPPLDRFRTLVHEYAHQSLRHGYQPDLSYEQVELEAEAVALSVCEHFGIETETNSYAYVASNGGTMEMLIKASDRIMEVVSEVINYIETGGN